MVLSLSDVDYKASWALLLSIISIILIVVPWAWSRIVGYENVWGINRPSVVNFPSYGKTIAWTRNPNVMERQLTRQEVRALHDRRGPVINFPNYGLPGMQPAKRPNPQEKNWW